MDKYLKVELGKYRLSALTSVKLNSFIVELCNKYNYKKSYFNNILKVLKTSFRLATDVFGFIRYNPAITLKLPKIEDEVEFEKHLYNQNEINTILERFKDDDVFTCAFITACYTGMRTGEVCSLTWDDIDFENRVINVKHTVYDKPDDGKGRWYMGTTKTKNGVRQIYMSPTLFQALINFKKKQQHLKKLYGSKYITYYFTDDAIKIAINIIRWVGEASSVRLDYATVALNDMMQGIPQFRDLVLVNEDFSLECPEFTALMDKLNLSFTAR